jgi:hypothetical protein
MACPTSLDRSSSDKLRLGTEEIQQLLTAYQDGATANQLAESFGVHRTTALDHLARNGVARRINVRKLDDHQVAIAADLYRAGKSLVTVAQHLGVNASTIARELRAACVELRPRRGWPPKSAAD